MPGHTNRLRMRGNGGEEALDFFFREIFHFMLWNLGRRIFSGS